VPQRVDHSRITSCHLSWNSRLRYAPFCHSSACFAAVTDSNRNSARSRSDNIRLPPTATVSGLPRHRTGRLVHSSAEGSSVRRSRARSSRPGSASSRPNGLSASKPHDPQPSRTYSRSPQAKGRVSLRSPSLVGNPRGIVPGDQPIVHLVPGLFRRRVARGVDRRCRRRWRCVRTRPRSGGSRGCLQKLLPRECHARKLNRSRVRLYNMKA